MFSVRHEHDGRPKWAENNENWPLTCIKTMLGTDNLPTAAGAGSNKIVGNSIKKGGIRLFESR